MHACADIHTHTRTQTDRESICLSWHCVEVDGIDLDLSHSFLHSAPPPLLSHFVFSQDCHSQSHSANHLSLRLQSHSQQENFGLHQHIPYLARAAQNVLANSV